MKRASWLFVVVVVIGLDRGLPAQSRPDFSGTWNASGSRLTIKHDAATLTVNDGSETCVYILDGSESRVERPGATETGQLTARTRWVQNALLIEARTVSKIGTWTDLEVYSLDYGPQLSVVRVYTQTRSPAMGTEVTTYKKN